MRLNYLPQPGMSAGAGIGAGLGALGKSMSDLGQLSLDEKEKKAKADMENTKLDLMKKETDGKNRYYDTSVKLQEDKFKSEEAREQYKRLQEAIDKKDIVAAFSASDPKTAKLLMDAGGEGAVYAHVAKVANTLPKDKDEYAMVDNRVYDGNAILTYMNKKNGKLMTHNLGKVDPKGRSTSDIPDGWAPVTYEDYEKYKKDGEIKSTKDGRWRAPIPYINKKWEEERTSLDADYEKLYGKASPKKSTFTLPPAEDSQD